jgi:hypothetical protein
LDAVLQALLVPALAEITPSLGVKVACTVEAWQGDSLLLRQPVALEPPRDALREAKPLGMTCRIRFRETSVAGRLLMHAECLAEHVDATTGFSGFNLRAAVKANGDEWEATRESLTIRYHNRVWAGP